VDPVFGTIFSSGFAATGTIAGKYLVELFSPPLFDLIAFWNSTIMALREGILFPYLLGKPA
jgi:hypothetical protein